MIKYFTTPVAAIILVITQVSFLAAWPMPVRALNLILSVVIFITVIYGQNPGLYLALACGLLLELFTPGLFGIVTISLLLTTLLVDWLLVHFFTNRSLYSILSLGIIGTVFYQAFFTVCLQLFSILGLKNRVIFFTIDYLNFVFWEIIFNALIVLLIFFIFRLVNRRFQQVSNF